MTADSMKKILKDEYGISSYSEFEVAVKNISGINLGMFTEPVRRNGEYEDKQKAYA